MSAKSNFALDVAVAAAFLVSSNPPLTGLAVHEWVGVSFAGAVVAHLLFHWNWVVQVTRRAFRRPPRGSRLNYAVDVWLFVALTATVLSGLLISRHLLPAVGLAAAPRQAWREIHSVATNAMLAGMGVHVGLHWTWLAFHLGRVPASDAIVTPAGRTLGLGAATPAADISRATPRSDERETAMAIFPDNRPTCVHPSRRRRRRRRDLPPRRARRRSAGREFARGRRAPPSRRLGGSCRRPQPSLSGRPGSRRRFRGVPTAGPWRA